MRGDKPTTGYNPRMKTTAALLRAARQPFTITTLDLAPPGPGEVQVRVKAAGVCHSDWHIVTGDTPFPMAAVLGHEGAGVIEAVGPGVKRLAPGDPVALDWAPSCGECFYCLNGRPSLCETFKATKWAGTMLDGTTRLADDGKPVYQFCSVGCFAERIVVSEKSAIKMPASVPWEISALIGCAVTTGVGAVVNTARVAAGSSVVVYGAGGVGLSVVMGAALAGAGRIIVVDRVPSKLEQAEDFGATHAVAAGPNAVDEIRALTGGRGADYVFEAIGIPAVQEEALRAARPGGMIILAGISPVGSATNLPGAVLTRQEKTVAGSYYGTANTSRDFPRLAELYLAKRLDLAKLVSRRYRLDQINEAYADMLTGEGARGIIVF